MQNFKILWADDEIDLLKPHILFLKQKGYDIVTVNSGLDAIEKVEEDNFDVIFLDEMMPGMTGLETLQQIKTLKPQIPVVMITKSEEEHIMDDAIGGKIADYLIKPINPNQIFLSVKKILQNKQLISEKTNLSYQQDFRNISMAYNDAIDHEEWVDIYKKLTYWELEIDETENKSMQEVLESQKVEANANFARFIKENYLDWLNLPKISKPVLSHQVMKKHVFPKLKQDKPLFFIVIDNLRLDQWEMIENQLRDYFLVKENGTYYSILPTTTAFSRNALFSGMMPLEMAKSHPDLWEGEDTDEGKNNHEEEFLNVNLKKNRLSIRSSYNKIIQTNQGKAVLDQFPNLMKNELNVLVYNFVDMMSHARTDMKMIRELAPDESAYRSLTTSWFLHSSLFELFKKISAAGAEVIVTTDHGTKRVNKPYKIIGDRNVTTNLRYKQGKNLNFESGKVFEVDKPDEARLPRLNISSSYVFAVEDYFFAYPNNYNYYVNYYRDTFQHGGVSLEEMIIPIVHLQPK
ncbi:T9SS response regulator signal transducer PorX [Cyclobacterium marinum]|uniref:Response regulator receiver protein n=1 Tax=Cyclobacterium marinum (strain ATCC 25205 / DSM 745 / LMG 13164 / NCIMB 1802) TaxID=880070 RepID=G0J4M8_CYCMS|nr:bifunctional response regulator/alkaline phosphatase family protein [Cyclobacterium marinum]AEL24693.1 response regulator receiver protein [Cyclobacterium marinum DSM 745]MBR9773528.1 bifunctional response regulator/alkaline phosphatase family protein [Cytophagales bacterium]|tara:strand:- start:42306 stop:43859 length:1554 start_codon:yes stop_codon:yes gene_type:complete